jgi:hypothetical protein
LAVQSTVESSPQPHYDGNPAEIFPCAGSHCRSTRAEAPPLPSYSGGSSPCVPRQCRSLYGVPQSGESEQSSTLSKCSIFFVVRI